MDEMNRVTFIWNEQPFEGIIEKVYENAVLIVVNNPSDELADKYLGRVVVSKKQCTALVS